MPAVASPISAPVRRPPRYHCQISTNLTAMLTGATPTPTAVVHHSNFRIS